MKAEDIDVSFEDAMKIAPPQLRKKIEHSVTLVRRAERLALEYDAEDGFYNTFSGGKDSQALFYIVKMAKVKFKTHMSLTSVDPADVIRFVKREYPSVVRHKPKMSMFADAVEKQILPTMRVRWCCADFKESAGAGKVTLIGIRAQESNRRAKRNEVEVSNRTFSGNLSQFFTWSESEKEKKMKKLKRKLNEDEFSVSTDNEVHCINGKDSILISPIFHWTEHDVWYFLNEIIHAPHCSLYDEGYTRIGCILCPMATPKSKRRDVERFPHVKRGWIKAIKAIRRGGYSETIISGGTSPKEIRQDNSNRAGSSIRQIPPPPLPTTARELWGNRENPRECTAEKNHPSSMGQIRRKLDILRDDQSPTHHHQIDTASSVFG